MADKALQRVSDILAGVEDAIHGNIQDLLNREAPDDPWIIQRESVVIDTSDRRDDNSVRFVLKLIDDDQAGCSLPRHVTPGFVGLHLNKALVALGIEVVRIERFHEEDQYELDMEDAV